MAEALKNLGKQQILKFYFANIIIWSLCFTPEMAKGLKLLRGCTIYVSQIKMFISCSVSLPCLSPMKKAALLYLHHLPFV